MTDADKTAIAAHMVQLVELADQHFDGHVTIMKFTTNWRVGFGTPTVSDGMELWVQIAQMPVAKTFVEAAEKAVTTLHEING